MRTYTKATSTHSLRRLHQILTELADRYRQLSQDELFTLWFLRAYVTPSEERACGALVGGKGDKSYDAILIDDAAKAVFVVQTKFRRALSTKREARNDLIGFADIANQLSTPLDSAFKQYIENMDELTAAQVMVARRQILRNHFRLYLLFVTLGKVSNTHIYDAESIVRRARCRSALEVIDGRRVPIIFDDYLKGVAPPVPVLDLEMEQAPNVRVNAIADRYDEANDIESWVFSMRGDAIGSLFESADIRLFARNVRGFLGPHNPVNEGMLQTLEQEPDLFFYFNNGITIVCDRAEKIAARGRDLLRVSNPQIINGQQTTRTLASSMKKATKAAVLVKVICVPRQDRQAGIDYDQLVSQIVVGTNWQTAITKSDLVSNDQRQIELESALRNRGYLYLRKRQTKGEARRYSGSKNYLLLRADPESC